MQTVHEKWNPNIAILSGDVLFVKAYELLSKNESNHLPSLLEVFNKTAIEVCEGQQLDMDFEQKSHVSKEEYIEMIRLKTSVLLGAALKMGAILGDASEENQQLIYEFGENLGIAFQIQDDLLDLYGQPDKVGKQVGGDILANKKTLLTILAKQDASEDETNKMNQIFKLSSDVEKVSQTISLFEQLEIESKCKEEIKYYFENSLSSLEKIKDCDSKENLKQLALFLFNREF
jgi:geranylgeranyl diphosphate synthase type II